MNFVIMATLIIFIITLVVAPMFVEIVTTLFDYWLNNRHNNKK